MSCLPHPVRDSYNLKSHKYVCITIHQPDTKSNSNPNPNPNPTTKHHAVVNIQLNIVTCPTYPDKFIRDNVVAPSIPLEIVMITLPSASGPPRLSIRFEQFCAQQNTGSSSEIAMCSMVSCLQIGLAVGQLYCVSFAYYVTNRRGLLLNNDDNNNTTICNAP